MGLDLTRLLAILGCSGGGVHELYFPPIRKLNG